MFPVDYTALLNQLPAPCLYLTPDRIIVYANVAAYDVVARQVDDGSGLRGCSIYDTTFTSDDTTSVFELDGAFRTIEAYLGQEERSTREERSYELKHSVPGSYKGTLKSRSPCWIWTMSTITVKDEPLFCLLAHKAPPAPSKLDNTPTPFDEKLDLLKRIAGPSFDNVDFYTSLVNEDVSARLVNAAGRKNLSVLAENVEKSKLDSQEWRVFNEDYTRALHISDGAGPIAMRAGKSALSILRGVEDHVTGERSIMDSSATLIYHPFKDELLGCMVQCRTGQEWSDYLVHQDLAAPSVASNDEYSSKMVRTMLLDGRLDYFSPAWEQYTGYNRRDLCAGKWLACVHPEDLSTVQQAMETALSTGKRQEYEVRYREADSETFRYFSDCIAPLKDASHKTTRWYCISKNIHELVAQRRAASEANQRIYRIIDDMDITIFEMDAEYNIKSAEGALPITMPQGEAQTADGFVGVSFFDAVKAVSPTGIDNFVQAAKDVMEGRSAKSMAEYQLGEQYMRTIMVPIKDNLLHAGVPNVIGLLGLTLDYSAQYKTEQAAMRIRAMEHTGRMKDEFLANISHELRTPIGGLLGLLDLLLETELSMDQLDLTQSLQTSAMGLSRIVNDLLDLSKTEANAMTIENLPFKLSAVLLELQKSCEMQALNKGLRIEFASTPCPMLVGDALRVRQILHNLLNNAIKFTQSGFVKLYAAHEVRDDSTVALDITVEDSGIGVDSETLARLFHPFVQADESTTRLYGGTGLGLSIARKLARAMGGEVTLSSGKEQGTVGKLSLVCQLATAQDNLLDIPSKAGGPNDQRLMQQHQGLKAQVPPEWTNASVLVVDDNAVNQKVVAGHLKSLGISQTSLAAHGEEAVAHIIAAMATEASQGLTSNAGASTTVKPASLPDLVFMDCQMPVLDGFEATRRIRSNLQYKGPIVALTASATQGYREKCLEAGMNDYITKPFTKKELTEVLQKWLQP